MTKKRNLSPSKARVMRDKDLVVRYYYEGRTMSMVSDKMLADHSKKMSISRISVIIKETTARWKTEQGDILTDQKAKEIENIDKLQMTYTMAWERSMLAAETLVKKLEPGRTPAAKQKVREAISTIRATAGDPRFLLGIQWCIDKRCELLGHAEPQKIEANITGSVTNNTTTRKIIFKSKVYNTAPETFVQKVKEDEE